MPFQLHKAYILLFHHRHIQTSNLDLQLLLYLLPLQYLDFVLLFLLEFYKFYNLYLYFHCHLWPYAGNLYADQFSAHPGGYPVQPGNGEHGAELSEVLVRYFQGLLILLCVGIYAVLIQGIATSGDPIGAIWGAVGYNPFVPGPE